MTPTKQPTACTQFSVQTIFKIQETYEQTNKDSGTDKIPPIKVGNFYFNPLLMTTHKSILQ
jgi:hypothetical protein